MGGHCSRLQQLMTLIGICISSVTIIRRFNIIYRINYDCDLLAHSYTVAGNTVNVDDPKLHSATKTTNNDIENENIVQS
jgi:hypothetical protein